MVTDKMYELFLKIAGEDKEIDWKELKNILDATMRDELASDGETINNSKNLNAIQSSSQHQDHNNNNNDCLIRLFGLICGFFCKDSSLVEILPLPNTINNKPLLNSFAELTKENGFSKDICRSMIAMMDKDRSGKLGFEEFKRLLIMLRNWKNVWILYDVDKSGTFSGFELRDAIQSAGYLLTNKILNVLMHRYGNRDGHLQFDDFILCAIKIKIMIDTFKEKDKNNTDSATFSLEEWLEATLST